MWEEKTNQQQSHWNGKCQDVRPVWVTLEIFYANLSIFKSIDSVIVEKRNKFRSLHGLMLSESHKGVFPVLVVNVFLVYSKWTETDWKPFNQMKAQFAIPQLTENKAAAHGKSSQTIWIWTVE